MNRAVPSRPVRPIRAERELREGGTRCSSRISPWYLLFSLQIRGKNDLSPRSPALRVAARSSHEPARSQPGGGARRQGAG